MLKSASEVIAQGDERAVVDFAIESNRELATINGELDKAKSHLRKLALGRVENEVDRVEIDGALGVATIVFGPSSVKGRKGKDLRDLEANLSEETFRRLFVKRVMVSPVENFASLVASVPTSEREVIERFVQVSPSTPKVYLPR